jgi:hypothetical protein
VGTKLNQLQRLRAIANRLKTKRRRENMAEALSELSLS